MLYCKGCSWHHRLLVHSQSRVSSVITEGGSSQFMVNLSMITVMITEGGLAVGATLAPVIVMIIADGAVIPFGVVVEVGTRGAILV